MKTFTVRELDRHPSEVLDEADRAGSVQIRRRDGRVYTLRPKSAHEQVTALPDFRGRIKRLFPQPIPKTQAKIFDKLLAGE